MKQFKVGKKAVKAAVLLCLLAVIVVVCVVVLMGNDSDTADSDLSEPKAESSQNTAKQVNTEEEQDMKTTEEQKKPEKETIEWNPDWEYADHSKIHTGSAVLYYSQAEDLKDKVICINAGHGTEGGSSESTLCHPDGSPKVTGGSTSEGAVTATAINEGTTLLNGTSEAEMNLRVAKLVKTKLLEEGFHVLMIRESDDVQLDNKLHCRLHGADMQAGVENREVAEVLGDILRCELLLAGNGEADCLSFFLLNLSFETYLFEIQNNVYYTLNDSGDSVKLMTDPFNPYGCNGKSLQRGQQDSAQGIANCYPVSGFQRAELELSESLG